MTIGVVVFPGSNCDRDVQWATEGCLNLPTRRLWHEETDLSGLDAVVLPGGGKGAENLAASQEVGAILKRHEEQGKILAAVCAAPTAFLSHDIGKGKIADGRKLEIRRDLSRHQPPAYLSRACFDVHYVRYSDAGGKPHSLFYLLFARELFHSVCFQYSSSVYCVSCYEILCEFSLGSANSVDASFHLDLPIM